MYSLSILSIFLLLSPFGSTKSFTKAKDAVLLSNVRTLTLQADKKTSHRRVSAIPQLTCTGGNAKGLYNVDVMRCTNSGAEYNAEDIQWTCQANLPAEFKLGSTEVVCEGYDNPDDPYILKGSCGVEYRLILTDEGEAKYGKKTFGSSTGKETYDYGRASSGPGLINTLWTILFWAVFLGIIGILLYRVFYPNRQINLPGLGGFGRPGGGGGGGGGGFNDDPPPPYTPRAPPRPKTESSSRAAPRSAPRSSQPRNSGPGFWSGAATGGAAGYGAGYYMGQREVERERERNRSRERARERSRERERERAHQSSMFNSRSNTGWFGGGGGGGPSSSGGGSSAAGPSSGSRYESTGFGGTRRR